MDKAAVETSIRRAARTLEEQHGMTRDDIEAEVLRIIRDRWAYLDANAKWEAALARRNGTLN